MKVLIVNQHKKDALGGSEIQCDIIANKLTDFGHDVVYFAVDGSMESYNCSYEVFPAQLDRKNIDSLLEQFHPDIIYWRYNKNKFLKSARYFLKIDAKFVFAISADSDVSKWKPQIYIRRDSLKNVVLVPYHLIVRPITHRMNHFGFHYVDAVVSLNPEFLNELSVSPQKTIFNSMETDTSDFEWDGDFVLWVSNLKQKKNPEKFIELAREFVDSSVDFLMVGNIQDKNYEFLQNDDGDLPDNLYYLGGRTPEQVNGIMSQALLFVRTDDITGFGNTFIQAWLQGIPTITLHHGTGKFIEEKDIGYVSGDFKQLCKDVEKLINNDKLREEMGSRAKAFADSTFHPESNVKELESFFNNIIDK